jgi:hypothetical protein
VRVRRPAGRGIFDADRKDNGRRARFRGGGAPMAPARTCPGCESALRAVALRGIELDRCDSCGGVWVDPHGLARLATERAGEPGSETPRCCPDCGYLLRWATAGDVLVERCPECSGLYLSADSLRTLAGETRAPLPDDAPAGAPRCVLCGRAPRPEETVLTSRGPACAACQGAVPPPPPDSATSTPYGLAGDAAVVADVVADLALPPEAARVVHVLLSLFGTPDD